MVVPIKCKSRFTTVTLMIIPKGIYSDTNTLKTSVFLAYISPFSVSLANP